jgi:anti-anti-sigma factor
MNNLICHPPTTSEDALIRVWLSGQAVVACIGCVSIREHQAVVIRDALTELASQHEGRLVVGLTEVCSMSAQCLADLATIRRLCESMGGKLVLFGLSDDVSRIVRSSGASRTFHIAQNIAEAIALIEREEPAGFIARFMRRKAA